MELEQAIRERRSIRKYTDRPVPRDVLEALIAKSVWAPSAMNTQPWRFYVVSGMRRTELEKILSRSFQALLPRLRQLFEEKMVQMVGGYFHNFGNAPHLVAVTTDRLAVPEYQDGACQSAAAAIQNFCLLAHEAGLGTCWMTGPLWVAKDVLAFLNVSDQRLVAVIAVGWPAQSPPVPPRKPGVSFWSE
jgi:nitroreductase